MAGKVNRKLVLEDGSEYYGTGFGDMAERVCEIVFNTSMAGYQEIVSDPSYTGQGLVMTYPLIGTYGITDDDFESKALTIGALIVSEYNDTPSNFRYTKTLSETLEEHHIPGIQGFDTRMLAKKLRDNGSCRAIITDADVKTEDALAKIAATPVDKDVAQKVSCKKRWYSRTPNHKLNVVAVDCGIKLSFIKALNAEHCNVTIVPFGTSAEEINLMKPDGVFISNGPGDPKDATSVCELINGIRGKYPIFGAGLGHQLIALAFGGDTFKMKSGHRGSTHAVKNLKTGRFDNPSQNHGYAVSEESLKGTGLTVTHINLLDKTVEGMANEEERIYSVQFHPETASGSGDSSLLFNKFIKAMMEAKKNA